MSDFKSQKELEDYLNESEDHWIKNKGRSFIEHLVDGGLCNVFGREVSLGHYSFYTKFKQENKMVTLNREQAIDALLEGKVVRSIDGEDTYRIDGDSLSWRDYERCNWQVVYGLFREFATTKEFTIVTDNSDKITSLTQTIAELKSKVEEAEKQILELK